MADEKHEKAKEGPKDAVSREGGASERLTVVFVEDLAALRRLVVAALGYEGIDVRPAGTIAEGLAAIVSSKADVLVTDLYLPDGTGRDLVVRARLVRPHLKAICVSGSPQHDPIFDRVVTKPFEIEHLAAEIRALARK